MRFHLFPFRTEKLSSLTPMVLRFSRGRVGSRLFKVRSLDLTFFYAPFRAPALQLPEKQIIRNGLAAMAAKKIGKIFRDLPERAIRPIRIRGALYLQMPLFALCCWRRFDCGGIVDRPPPCSICNYPCVHRYYRIIRFYQNNSPGISPTPLADPSVKALTGRLI